MEEGNMPGEMSISPITYTVSDVAGH